MEPSPQRLELDRATGLTVHWAGGGQSFFPVELLRRLSPSAEARELRNEMAANPLTVLPSRPSDGPIQATDAELVGNYALRVVFSDGHRTGLFTWQYLRDIDPDAPGPPPSAGSGGP